MICKYCGEKLEPSQRKCPSCGQRVDSASACGGFAGLVDKLPADVAEVKTAAASAAAAAAATETVKTETAGQKGGRRQQPRTGRGPVLPIVLGLVALAVVAVLVLIFLGGGSSDKAEPTMTPPPEAEGTETPAPTFDITLADCENGAVTTLPEGSAEAGKEITVTATPAEGYRVDKVCFQPAGGQENEVAADAQGAYKFSMPDAATTVSATFAKLADDTYTVRFDADPAAAGGSVTATPSFGKAGEEVTLTAQSAEGYVLDGDITITYEQDGKQVEQTVENGARFTMPGAHVRVTAQFKALPRVTVKNGTADKAYAQEGEPVTVSATVGRDKTFTGWSASGVTLSSSQKNKEKNMTFTMPANDVTLTANSKAAPTPTAAASQTVAPASPTAKPTPSGQANEPTPTAATPSVAPTPSPSPTPKPVDKSKLVEAIGSARTMIESYKVSVDGMDVPTTERYITPDLSESLSAALDAAQNVNNNPNATEQEVEDAISNLRTETSTASTMSVKGKMSLSSSDAT